MPESNDPLHIVVAAMLVEYEEDEACDYCKINRMIEVAASIVQNRIGRDRDQLYELADRYDPNTMWDLK